MVTFSRMRSIRFTPHLPDIYFRWLHLTATEISNFRTASGFLVSQIIQKAYEHCGDLTRQRSVRLGDRPVAFSDSARKLEGSVKFAARLPAWEPGFLGSPDS